MSEKEVTYCAYCSTGIEVDQEIECEECGQLYCEVCGVECPVCGHENGED